MFKERRPLGAETKFSATTGAGTTNAKGANVGKDLDGSGRFSGDADGFGA